MAEGAASVTGAARYGSAAAPGNPGTSADTTTRGRRTLKTPGYHLEHNFGHGDRHLSEALFVVNLQAFFMQRSAILGE